MIHSLRPFNEGNARNRGGAIVNRPPKTVPCKRSWRSTYSICLVIHYQYFRDAFEHMALQIQDEQGWREQHLRNALPFGGSSRRNEVFLTITNVIACHLATRISSHGGKPTSYYVAATPSPNFECIAQYKKLAATAMLHGSSMIPFRISVSATS